MDFNISDEHMEELLEQAIHHYVRDSITTYAIDRKVDDLIAKAVNEALSKKFDATVRAIVDEFLVGPVDINDGWGGREHYDSYSDFFAKKLHEQMNNSYRVSTAFRDALQKKVDEAWTTYKTEAIQEVLARHAAD